jgi:hypothetical protein
MTRFAEECHCPNEVSYKLPKFSKENAEVERQQEMNHTVPPLALDAFQFPTAALSYRNTLANTSSQINSCSNP